MNKSVAGGLLTAALMLLVMVVVGAVAAGPKKECVEWETVYPTPTPIPLSNIYSEWIPVPGTAPGTGHGWVRATELAKARSQWPPKEILTAHILTDSEYEQIAEEHGNPLTQGGKWTYGFPPRQGFPLLYGGVVLKNKWLPARLQN